MKNMPFGRFSGASAPVLGNQATEGVSLDTYQKVKWHVAQMV